MKTQISLIFVLAFVLFMGSFVSSQIPPTPENDTGVILINPEEPKQERSQAEKDCVNNEKKCWSENSCHSQGYIKDGKYCSEKAIRISSSIYHSGFVNQSETGQSCIQGYECKTGVCSNNICINLTEQQNQLELLNSDFIKLSQENVRLQQNLENLNNSVSETEQFIEENDSLVQKITNFLKNLFDFSK